MSTAAGPGGEPGGALLLQPASDQGQPGGQTDGLHLGEGAILHLLRHLCRR